MEKLSAPAFTQMLKSPFKVKNDVETKATFSPLDGVRLLPAAFSQQRTNNRYFDFAIKERNGMNRF